MATIHELKFAHRELCDAVYYGVKCHEIRKNDRDFQIGDIIKPLPINDDGSPMTHPIASMLYRITFISDEFAGIEKGYCVMTIKEVSTESGKN